MRKSLLLLVALLALSLIAGPAVAKNGNGNGPDRDNSKRSEATPIDLDPGDIEVVTTDVGAANFDETFDYYVVRHGVEYDEAVYREPARTGPDNFRLGESDAGAFWFSVSAPDADGVQHRIDHRGQVAFFMKDADTGEWMSLKAQFNGKGELVHVNGVKP